MSGSGFDIPKTLADALRVSGWQTSWDAEGQTNFVHLHRLDYLCLEDFLGLTEARWYEWETGGGFHSKVYPLDSPELITLVLGMPS